MTEDGDDKGVQEDVFHLPYDTYVLLRLPADVQCYASNGVALALMLCDGPRRYYFFGRRCAACWHFSSGTQAGGRSKLIATLTSQ